MSNILEFRIAHLKALSLCWRDANFKKEFLAQDNILDFFETHSSLFNGYKNPFKHLTIKVSTEERVKWDPKWTAGWVGHNDNITIVLPTAPKNKALHASALFDYYSLFPNFLGPLKTGPGHVEACSPSMLNGPIPLELGIGDDEITDFGALMLRVISLFWSDDEEFKHELITASKNGNASPILSKYFGYNNPWNFDLRFEKAPENTFEYHITEVEVAGHKVETGNWKFIQNNTINLWYPEPTEVEFQPTALTEYNNDGPAYPFTCS